MAIIKISEWLKSKRNYDAGVALYKKYGSNKVLMQTFTFGKNKYSEKKLADELTKREHATSDDAITIKKKPKKETPVDVQELHLRTKEKYKDMSALHSHLEDAMSDEERNELAHKILDLDDEVTAGYEAVDHFEDTGKRIEAPAEKKHRGKDVQKMNLTESYKALQSIPTYISKAKKKLKSESDPGKITTLQGNIQRYEDDLKFIKNKLNIV